MTKTDKLIKAFLNRPQTLRYTDIQKALILLGFEIVSAKGSHTKFKHSMLEHDLVIPVHGNECKDFYKKEASRIVKKSIINN